MDDQALTEALLAQGLARKTVAVYVTAVRRVGAELDLATVGAGALYGWVEEHVPPSRSSRALLRSALRAAWVASGRSTGPWRAVPVPRRPRMRCRALEGPQAAALGAVAAARARRGTRKGVAVLLGLYAGLRRSEIASLRWADVGADGWVRVVGKGAERSVPLHPAAADALGALRALSSPPPPGGPQRARVFAGARGPAVNPTTVWTWTRQLAAEAGVPGVTTHVLRHTALTAALEASRDLRAVQELAGHARPETTAGYTRAGPDRLRAAALAVDFGAPA